MKKVRTACAILLGLPLIVFGGNYLADMALFAVPIMEESPGARLLQAMRDGGLMTLEDLASYRVAWSKPVHTTFWEWEVYAAGLPGMGGINTIECLNLLEASDPDPVDGSADSFFWWIQLTNVYLLSFVSPAVTAMVRCPS